MRERDGVGKWTLHLDIESSFIVIPNFWSPHQWTWEREISEIYLVLYEACSIFKLAGKELQFLLRISLYLYLLLCILVAHVLHHLRSWAIPQSLFPAGPVGKTGQNEFTSFAPMGKRKHKEIGGGGDTVWVHLCSMWAREKGLSLESDHLQFSKLQGNLGLCPSRGNPWSQGTTRAAEYGCWQS